MMRSDSPLHPVLLVALIVAPACYAAATEETPIRAGAAISNITPKPGVSLDGVIMQIGPVESIHDELYARALVLDDGTTQVAIVICDVCMIGREVCEKAKAIVNRQTRLPANQILCAATHSHCVPRAVHVGTGPLDDEYHDLLARRIADSVIQATENLAPARIGWGSVARPDYPRCRRWLMKPGTAGPNPFGETFDQVKMTSAKNSNAIKPVCPVDPELFVLSVQHADGRPLALLGNYSIHYVAFQPGVVSADYFGYFARQIEALLQPQSEAYPFVGIMSNGTSGDTNADSGQGDPFDRMKKVGHHLAEDAERLYRQITHRNRMSLAVIQTEVELAVRRPDEKRILWANTTWAEARKQVEAGKRLTRPQIYAREATYLTRFPDSVSLPLQVIRIGELAIVAIPCEVFAETGLAIKRSSPFRSTFTISLANGYAGYLPPPEQHRLGGYTTWPARSSYLEIQAEPKIRKAILSLLEELSARHDQDGIHGMGSERF